MFVFMLDGGLTGAAIKTSLEMSQQNHTLADSENPATLRA